ncbi:MAG TPA: FHA domain-containing protein, partial [Solirubrobacteraceae bacterium]|nr:FHA domain-containing protein [Solirubrobacteraceae bacterium]
VYSISEEDRRPLAATPPGSRALLVGAGRRTIVPAVGGVIGRSRQCDIMLADSNVSRRHAELRPAADGWEISDLGSTNGVRVNGRKISSSHPLSSGDMIELGSSELRFELE